MLQVACRALRRLLVVAGCMPCAALLHAVRWRAAGGLSRRDDGVPAHAVRAPARPGPGRRSAKAKHRTVCACVRARVCVRVRVCACVSLCACACMRPCVLLCACVRLCACVSWCVCACVVRVCLRACARVCARARACSIARSLVVRLFHTYAEPVGSLFALAARQVLRRRHAAAVPCDARAVWRAAPPHIPRDDAGPSL